MADKQFVVGLIPKLPKYNTPKFIKMHISIRRKELGNFLRQMDGDWINVDIKESKGGKLYAEVNTWKPEKKKQEVDDEFNDDVPF